VNLATLFLERHDTLQGWMAPLAELPDVAWRTRPHGLNPIAWLVWHTARCEDAGLNRLVFDHPQILDDPGARWRERMNVPWRHHGATMTSAEVDELAARADVAALWAYHQAVKERTRGLVAGGLDDELLDPLVDPDHLRRVLFDAGILRPQHPWNRDEPPYRTQRKGTLLILFGMIHCYGHWHDIGIVRSFVASSR
jgi:hypothetical protein